MTTSKKYRGSITARMEYIGPAQALAYLGMMLVNRPLRPSRVKRFVHLLRTGQFRQTHQGIAFNALGELMDGQHRLRAIVESGIGAWMLVARGVDPGAFDGLDGPGTRTGGDNLAIVGVADYSRVSAFATGVLRYRNGDDPARVTGAVPVTPPDIVALIKSEPAVSQWIAGFKPLRIWATPAPIYTALWVVGIELGAGAEWVRKFGRALLDETGGPGSPSYALAERLKRSRYAAKAGPTSQFRLGSQQFYAYTLLAWNNYAKGKSVSRLSWKDFTKYPVPYVGG